MRFLLTFRPTMHCSIDFGRRALPQPARAAARRSRRSSTGWANRARSTRSCSRVTRDGRCAPNAPWIRQPPAGCGRSRLPRVDGVGTPTGVPGDFVCARRAAAATARRSRRLVPIGSRCFSDRNSTREPVRSSIGWWLGRDQNTTPRGPVGMTFLSAELVEPGQAINTALRTNGVLGTRLAEIVIAATGREMNSQISGMSTARPPTRPARGRAVLDAIREGLHRRGARRPGRRRDRIHSRDLPRADGPSGDVRQGCGAIRRSGHGRNRRADRRLPDDDDGLQRARHAARPRSGGDVAWSGAPVGAELAIGRGDYAPIAVAVSGGG